MWLLPLSDTPPGRPLTEAPVDPSKPIYILADARAAGGAAPVLLLLGRLESAAHILLWCEQAVSGAVNETGGVLNGRGDAGTASSGSVGADGVARLSRVELPRLGLSFSRRGDRLYCEQQPGFWLSDARPAYLQSLITGGCAPLCLGKGYFLGSN
jgi:hypothetical protein